MWRLLSRAIQAESALALVIVAGALSSPIAAHSQALTTLYNFQGPATDGSWPCAGVIRDSGGNMYGTTQVGGNSDYGTVFELDGGNAEAESVLHNFEDDDGQSPCAPLIHSADGYFYGTTISGGYSERGTVFSIRGTQLTVLYKFQGIPDGQSPFGGLDENIDGALYGTTAQGGNGACAGGCGTIYRIDKAGRETVLYSFSGPDGAYPAASLIHDPAGNLYGTTNGSVANDLCPAGCGTVFKLDTSGKLTVLHSFTGGTQDGWFVVTPVVRDAAGNLYGTTSGGGTWNFGTIYEITNRGKEKVLYSFAGPPDGATPNQLVIAHGKLYGTTYLGGQLNCNGISGLCGTIFEFDKSGGEKVLYRFSGFTDGEEPTGPVTFDSDGNMYGTTQSGIKDGCPFSHGGCGTVWKFAVADIP
jgi:uncharacterized repeat protein (TIGR03803 family)